MLVCYRICPVACVRAKFSTGKPVDLPPESEEVAGFYGAMIETDHAQDAVFNKNFFTDFKKVLKDHPPVRLMSTSVSITLSFLTSSERWNKDREIRAMRLPSNV